jgi:hypothetical protein
VTLSVVIEASEVAEGVWQADLCPESLRVLGVQTNEDDKRTIIGVIQPNWNDGRLEFGHSASKVLNQGSSNSVLFVDIALPRRCSEDINAPDHGRGDESFLLACDQYLSEDVADVGRALVQKVREFSPGVLNAGQGRKWVNSPYNFVAFTVQNRDNSIAITVRGEPDRHHNTPLQLKRDRPGYSRFKVSSISEVAPAAFVVRRALELFQTGRSKDALYRTRQDE